MGKYGADARGFSLIELLLVTTIIGILAIPISLQLFNFRVEQGLGDSVSVAVAVLRDAQQKSITQENDSQWGVRFDGDNDWYDLFQVSDGVLSLRQRLPVGVTFSDPSVGTKEILFGKISGCRYEAGICAANSIEIKIQRTGGAERTITVNKNGTVIY